MLKLIRSFKSKFHLKRVVIKQNWKKELNMDTKKKKNTEYLEIAFLLFVTCICTQWITWIHGLFQYISNYLHLGVTKGRVKLPSKQLLRYIHPAWAQFQMNQPGTSWVQHRASHVRQSLSLQPPSQVGFLLPTPNKQVVI